MHRRVSNDKLGLSCPMGGHFWVCENKPSRFIGCCRSNPCETESGECPDRDLTQSSFDPRAAAAAGGQLRGQGCISTNDNSNSHSISNSNSNRSRTNVSWYACAETKPPFLGCCASDACSQGGCDAMSLRAARLSRDHDAAASLLMSAGNNVSGRVLTRPWTGTAVTALGSSSSGDSETRALGLTHDQLVALGGALIALTVVFALTSAALLWIVVKQRRKVNLETWRRHATLSLSSLASSSLPPSELSAEYREPPCRNSNLGVLMSMQQEDDNPGQGAPAEVAPLFCQHPQQRAPQHQQPFLGQAVSPARSLERTPSQPPSPRMSLSRSLSPALSAAPAPAPPLPGPAPPRDGFPVTAAPAPAATAACACASPQSTKPTMPGAQINLARVRSRARILSGMESATGLDQQQYAFTFEDEWGRPEHS